MVNVRYTHTGDILHRSSIPIPKTLPLMVTPMKGVVLGMVAGMLYLEDLYHSNHMGIDFLYGKNIC